MNPLMEVDIKAMLNKDIDLPNCTMLRFFYTSFMRAGIEIELSHKRRGEVGAQE